MDDYNLYLCRHISCLDMFQTVCIIQLFVGVSLRGINMAHHQPIQGRPTPHVDANARQKHCRCRGMTPEEICQ